MIINITNNYKQADLSRVHLTSISFKNHHKLNYFENVFGVTDVQKKMQIWCTLTLYDKGHR